MTPIPVDREINLAAVFQVIWDRGRKIFGFAFLVAVLVYVSSLALANRYGATVLLQLAPSKVGTRSLQIYTVDDYTHYIINDWNLTQILEKYPALREPPIGFKTIDDLEGRIDVNRVGETNVIEVYIELEDSALAGDVCNALADMAVDMTIQLARSEIETTSNLFANVLKLRVDEVDHFQNTYLEMQKQDHMDSLREEIANRRTIMEGNRAQIENLRVSDVELTVRIAALEKELNQVKPVLTFDRSLSEDNMLLESARGEGQKLSPEQILKATITVEQVNESYYRIDEELRKLRAQLEGDRSKKTFLQSELESMRNTIRAMENNLFDMEMAQKIAQNDWMRKLEIFSGIDKEEGWAGATVLANRAILQKLNPAVTDDKPESPKRTALAGVAGMMTFLLSLAYFILRDLHHFAIDRAWTS